MQWMRKLLIAIVLLFGCAHERIPSASMNVTVRDTPATITTLSAVAQSVGGYVSETRVWREGGRTKAVVTMRLPADKVSPMVAIVRAISESVEAERMTTAPRVSLLAATARDRR